MITLSSYISSKSIQLAYYVRSFLFHQVTHQEVEIFIWDALEEWTQVDLLPDAPYSLVERVYWHLIHQIKYWPESSIKTDDVLRSELLLCCSFLEGKGSAPLDCIGLRP